MTMEWLSVAIIFLLLAMNIKLMLSVKKQQAEQAPAGIHEDMAEFIAQIEKENKELYDKLLSHLKGSESDLVERIERLEEKLASEFEEVPEIDSIETEKIMQLSRQGFSFEQIAKVLQTEYGKVELVVNRNNQHHENTKEDEVL